MVYNLLLNDGIAVAAADASALVSDAPTDVTVSAPKSRIKLLMFQLDCRMHMLRCCVYCWLF